MSARGSESETHGNAEFKGSFAETGGHHAVLRAIQSPIACVRWVGHGIGQLDARGGVCSCAGWGTMARDERHSPPPPAAPCSTRCGACSPSTGRTYVEPNGVTYALLARRLQTNGGFETNGDQRITNVGSNLASSASHLAFSRALAVSSTKSPAARLLKKEWFWLF